MESTAALAVDLALLTAALDQTGTDIAETLRSLERDVIVAIPSYMGLTVAVQTAQRSYTFSVSLKTGDARGVRASIRIPLSHPASSTSLIIYASQPGACVDLAADLAWLTGSDLTEFDLDVDLVMPPRNPGGLSDASTIDQAIGVLIAAGHTPEEAHDELDARARADDRDRLAVAGDILRALPVVDAGESPLER